MTKVIDPKKVRIVGEACKYGTFEELADKEVCAVTNSEAKSLLYAPVSGQFALAFGDNPENLSILGFSSDDALTEWLG